MTEKSFGYISPSMKKRLQRIKKANRRLTESYLIEKGLKAAISQVEKELGLTEKSMGS